MIEFRYNHSFHWAPLMISFIGTFIINLFFSGIQKGEINFSQFYYEDMCSVFYSILMKSLISEVIDFIYDLVFWFILPQIIQSLEQI
jgi:ABC-type microcin C transport system permease subunit YejB